MQPDKKPHKAPTNFSGVSTSCRDGGCKQGAFHQTVALLLCLAAPRRSAWDVLPNIWQREERKGIFGEISRVLFSRTPQRHLQSNRTRVAGLQSGPKQRDSLCSGCSASPYQPYTPEKAQMYLKKLRARRKMQALATSAWMRCVRSRKRSARKLCHSCQSLPLTQHLLQQLQPSDS